MRGYSLANQQNSPYFSTSRSSSARRMSLREETTFRVGLSENAEESGTGKGGTGVKPGLAS